MIPSTEDKKSERQPVFSRQHPRLPRSLLSRPASGLSRRRRRRTTAPASATTPAATSGGLLPAVLLAIPIATTATRAVLSIVRVPAFVVAGVVESAIQAKIIANASLIEKDVKSVETFFVLKP